MDILKIDRSFVATLTESGEPSALVRGLLGLGRTLDLEVIAEGVERDRAARAAATPRGACSRRATCSHRRSPPAEAEARLADVPAARPGLAAFELAAF